MPCSKNIIALMIFSFCLISSTQCFRQEAAGICPNITYAENSFETNAYLGKWYEIARTKNIPFESGNCTQHSLSLSSLNPDIINILNSELRADGNYSMFYGMAAETNNPFKFKIFSGNTYSNNTFGEYQILYTNYKTFSIVYSCTRSDSHLRQHAWILSRTPQLPRATLDNLLTYLKNNLGISRDQLYFTNQTASLCGY